MTAQRRMHEHAIISRKFATLSSRDFTASQSFDCRAKTPERIRTSKDGGLKDFDLSR